MNLNRLHNILGLSAFSLSLSLSLSTRIVGALRLIARALAKSGFGALVVVGDGRHGRSLCLFYSPERPRERGRPFRSLIRCLFISQRRRRKVAFKGVDR